MNNTYTTIIGLIVRAFFLWLMGALASHLSPSVYDLVNNIITVVGGTDAVIAWTTGTVGLVLLGIYLKLKSKLHLDIALNLPRNSTVANVKAEAQNQSVISTLTDPAPK